MEQKNLLNRNEFADKRNSFRKPGILHGSVIFSIVMVLLLFVASRAQRHEEYSGLLITEYLLILPPPLIMLYLFRFDVKKVLRLNKIDFLNVVLIFFITVFSIPLVSMLNLVNLVVLEKIFGRVVVSQPSPAVNWYTLLLSIFIVGITPAICEEILFRGTIQRSFERYGAVKSILITAFLFGLFHMDFQKLLGTFLLGALIGFIVYRTDSLYGGMVVHFTNNTAAVVLTYLLIKLNDFISSLDLGENSLDLGDVQGIAENTSISSIFDMPTPQLIAVIVFYAFIFIFCAAIFGALLYAFIKNTSKSVKPIPAQNITQAADQDSAKNALWLIPGLVIIVFMYVSIAFKLKGVESEFLNRILKFTGLG